MLKFSGINLKRRFYIVVVLMLLAYIVTSWIRVSHKSGTLDHGYINVDGSGVVLKTSTKQGTTTRQLDADIFDFEGFDNQNGTDHMIIPNIVHLLYLQTTNFTFYQMINIFSIYLIQKPDLIYIHCDNCSFHGERWDRIRAIDDLRERLVIHPIAFHETIFGIKYGWVNHHRSDVLRLLVLMHYGGIFLDNDVYVIRSLDEFRKFEMAVSWDAPDQGLGVQVLIAHKNARLLRAHFDRYRTNYSSGNWYYNAGHVPAEIMLKNPDLAHVVKLKFGTHMLIHNLYKTIWDGWKEFYTVHLLINHRSYLDKESPIKEFDENNILTFNRTYGIMCRKVMDLIDAVEKVQKDVKSKLKQ